MAVGTMLQKVNPRDAAIKDEQYRETANAWVSSALKKFEAPRVNGTKYDLGEVSRQEGGAFVEIVVWVPDSIVGVEIE